MVVEISLDSGSQGTVEGWSFSTSLRIAYDGTDGFGYSTTISFELGDDDPQDEFVVEL